MLSTARFWLSNTGLILLCYWSGPFGTIHTLPAGLRMVYWALSVLCTSCMGVWAHGFLRVQEGLDFGKNLAVAIVFGLMASGVVALLSIALLDPIQSNPGPLELFLYSFPSATAIFLTLVLFDRKNPEGGTQQQLERPALFKRLKTYQAAHSVLALRAQDHYVEVITELGSELCLLRLSDAISEAAPINGLRIHRSHWVAVAAIKKLEMQGSEQTVLLTDGTHLKISKSRVKELREVLGGAS
ncbi:LytTR family DNA-binding domain-containing protein (plasmid) [Aliisedimentitalea scapharcae]|uniref:LytTR family DNA-binding domain-containing protein n=1 Tax=Aliisedimentitalea scapharcae TaxID=1524259 RepID=A0ABZ2XZS2_9RHOB